MTHTSWINERGAAGRDNERLEYLGDAVLELVAAEYLFNRFPTYDEGQLTQMRSSLVSTVALAGLGEQLGLGEALRLGRGATKSGARRLTSLRANAFEALVGATFLDQGYKKAGKIFLSRIGDLSSWTDPNFKGRLQALAQERFGQAPVYRTLAGSDSRAKQYLSQVSVEGGPVLGEGRGGSKAAAEQGAARAAIDVLVAPAPKRRRRRSRSVPSAAVAPLTPVELQAVTAEVPPAPEETATGRRRRRSRSRTRSTGASEPELPGLAPAQPPGETEQPAPAPPKELSQEVEAPEAAGAEAVPKRRSRRGRRGGRRRSGRAADASPPDSSPQ